MSARSSQHAEEAASPDPTARVIDSRAGAGPSFPLKVWEWSGDAPPCLLLHGIGNYGRYWDFFADAVAGRLRLVAPDARGHGESGQPDGAYAPEEFVADAIAILDALAIDSALLVGHSMGGTHAIRLAAAHPDRVRRLVVVDAGPEPLPEGSERARRLSLERQERFEYADDALAYLRRTSPGYSEDVYRNRMRWLFKEDFGDFVWRSGRDALASIMSGRGSDLWEALRAVRCPVLVVRGTRSNV
ncbi:MAG: alpha/beta hydrolase, partial [Chloroflexota bacterium]